MKKWGGDIDIDAELEQIQREKAMLQDSYTQDLNLDIGEGTDPLEE
jgi:hypothetical protein